MKHQSPDQLVDVSQWQIDDNFSPYPEGSRSKNAVFCPVLAPYTFLIKDHRYLFKLSNPNYPAQFWMEIVAYRLGCLMGVAVPPAFAAINTRKNQNAALIEWFYGPKLTSPTRDRRNMGIRLARDVFRRFFEPKEEMDTTPVRYVSGGNYMARMIPDYDLEKGRQHNLSHLMRISHRLTKAVGAPDPIEHWAKVFLFDALIGNQDRHQDNWGVIWHGIPPDQIRAELSPAFDNGTSLGHEIMEGNFPKFDDDDRLAAYVARGRHHVKWKIDDTKRCQHGDLIALFKKRYPSSTNTMIKTLQFNMNEFKDLLFELAKFNVPDRLTEARCAFILKLINCRRLTLLRLLEE